MGVRVNVSDDDEESESTEELSCIRRCADSIANNDKFKLFITIVIGVNAVFMAMQADNPDSTTVVFGQECSVWSLSGMFFVFIFLFEIIVRIVADGCRGFWCDPDEWGWNIFDAVVVFGGCFDFLLEHVFNIGLQNQLGGQPLMMARVLRILRILRVVRVFRSFKKLSMLARGLVESIKTVFWIGVLVLLMIFLCGILCTTIIGQNEQEFPLEDRPDIRLFWGSVGRSMFTLFQFLTMDDWAAVENQVSEVMPVMRPFFLMYIFFGAFVIMSLLTGVMADHMNDVRRSEEEDERRNKLREREHTIKVAKKADINNDGHLDRDEFQKLICNPKFAKTLGSAGVSLRAREAKELFEWFDVNGDGVIDDEELHHGLKNLFEGISGLQMYKLKLAIKRAQHLTEQRVAKFDTSSVVSARRPPPSQMAVKRLAHLTEMLGQLEERIERFETQVRTFMSTFGWQPTPIGGDSPSASDASPISPQ